MQIKGKLKNENEATSRYQGKLKRDFTFDEKIWYLLGSFMIFLRNVINNFKKIEVFKIWKVFYSGLSI